MKILYVTGGPLDFGGISSWMYNYCKYIVGDDIRIDILVHKMEPGEREQDFLDLGIRVYHVPYKRENPALNELLIRKYIREGHYDIVHSHMDGMNAHILKIAQKEGVPVRISHCHSSRHLTIKNRFNIKYLIHEHERKLIPRYATELWACSDKAGTWLYGSNRDFLIIPNAIDAEAYRLDWQLRDKIRSELGYSDKEIVIGHVGHFTEIKNHRFLIDIFEKLYRSDARYRLMLIGDGPLKDSIMALCSSKRLEGVVTFVPASHNIVEYYDAMDIFVLPSVAEGLPLTVVEAQYNGLPVIISEGVSGESLISTNSARLPFVIDEWTETILNVRSTEHNNVITDDERFNVKCYTDYLKRKYRGMG